MRRHLTRRRSQVAACWSGARCAGVVRRCRAGRSCRSSAAIARRGSDRRRRRPWRRRGRTRRCGSGQRPRRGSRRCVGAGAHAGIACRRRRRATAAQRDRPPFQPAGRHLVPGHAYAAERPAATAAMPVRPVLLGGIRDDAVDADHEPAGVGSGPPGHRRHRLQGIGAGHAGVPGRAIAALPGNNHRDVAWRRRGLASGRRPQSDCAQRSDEQPDATEPTNKCPGPGRWGAAGQCRRPPACLRREPSALAGRRRLTTRRPTPPRTSAPASAAAQPTRWRSRPVAASSASGVAASGDTVWSAAVVVAA